MTKKPNDVYELPELELVEQTLSNRVAKVTNLDHHLSVPASWLLVLLMRGVPQDAPSIETNPADAAQSGDAAADVATAPDAVATEPAAVADESSGDGSNVVTPSAARKRPRRK